MYTHTHTHTYTRKSGLNDFRLMCELNYRNKSESFILSLRFRGGYSYIVYMLKISVCKFNQTSHRTLCTHNGSNGYTHTNDGKNIVFDRHKHKSLPVNNKITIDFRCWNQFVVRRLSAATNIHTVPPLRHRIMKQTCVVNRGNLGSLSAFQKRFIEHTIANSFTHTHSARNL